MSMINLRYFYPWYIENQFVEVSDEVAEVLRGDKLYEAAHQRRVTRNKARYPLNRDDGIEYSVCLSEPTPQELLERKEAFCHLCCALNSLPEAQRRRIDACIILGKSMKEVAEDEGVSISTVHNSIRFGLKSMGKYLKNL